MRDFESTFSFIFKYSPKLRNVGWIFNYMCDSRRANLILFLKVFSKISFSSDLDVLTTSYYIVMTLTMTDLFRGKIVDSCCPTYPWVSCRPWPHASQSSREQLVVRLVSAHALTLRVIIPQNTEDSGILLRWLSGITTY
jgi:hypothetical protein